MNPAPFEYHRVGSVDEAIALLRQYGDEAKLLAGGHSLLPIMKLRLAQPAHLVDLGALDDLRGIRRDGDTIRIGAMTTHHAIEQDELLRSLCPILPEAASVIGDRQVRNRGTVGGALAHADAPADYPAVVLALEAELVARGRDGEREIPATDFFRGFLTTALNSDEVLTEIRIPVPPARTGMSYQKLADQASGYAVVGIAAVVSLNGDGTCHAVRVGITGAGPYAVRATGVEEALVGQHASDGAIRAAADHAADGIDLLDEIHASAAYRGQVTRGLTRRALTAAAANASAAIR